MRITFLCDPLWLEFLFRRLDRQIQRAGNPIRQVREPDQADACHPIPSPLGSYN